MNIVLWVVQILLALHTLVGAIWKFSNSVEKTMPSLKSIPHGIWIGMAVVEIIFTLFLALPLFNKNYSSFAPIAALGIAVEMVIFSALHIFSGDTNFGPIVYWGVVAAICAFIAYGRLALKP